MSILRFMALLLQVCGELWAQFPLCAAMLLIIWCICVVIYVLVVPWLLGAWITFAVCTSVTRAAVKAGEALLGLRHSRLRSVSVPANS